MPNFAQLAVPLQEFTKTGAKFDWSVGSCQKSFYILRKRLTVAPILAHQNICAAVSGERLCQDLMQGADNKGITEKLKTDETSVPGY
uniref:Uncharacterized protein n=1 Tax=Parascaris equorum TaxID=6256 RepID=A0A914S662_PAREQ